jgi:hypothetical protein
MPPCMCKVETFYFMFTAVLCSSISYIISKKHKACVSSTTLQKYVTTYWLQHHNTLFQACCIHSPCSNWYRCNTFEFGAVDWLTVWFPGWTELGVMLLGLSEENARIQVYWYAHNKNRNLPKQKQKLVFKSYSRNKPNMELSAVRKCSVMKSGYWGILYWQTIWPFTILFSFLFLCFKIFLLCYLNENLVMVYMFLTSISVKADACQHPAFKLFSTQENIAHLLVVPSKREHQLQKTQMSSNAYYEK